MPRNWKTNSTRPVKLKKPKRSAVMFLIFWIIVIVLAIYGIIALKNELDYLLSFLAYGDFMAFLNESLSFVEGTTWIFAGLVVGLILFVFMTIFGVHVDMAKRSGFPVTSRKKLFFSPLLYTMTVLAAAFPIAFYFIQFLLSLELTKILVWFIPAFFGVLGLLIFLGSLPLWILHRKEASIRSSVLFSARLMLSPLIDVFWSAAASFVGMAIAVSILAIAGLANLVILVGDISRALNQSNIIEGIIDAFRSVVEFGLSDGTLLLFMIPFVVIGILMSINIFRKGVSFALADFFLWMGLILPASTVIATIILSTYLGRFALLFWLLIIIPLIIVCVVLWAIYWGSAFLTAGLGISGVFGLLVAVVSGLFLVLAFGVLPNIPIVGPLVADMISQHANWLNIMAGQIGWIGVIAGIVIIALSLRWREEEAKQVFSQAIAISVGVSTALPFLLITVLHLPGIFGGIIGVVLVFVMISPVYLLSVSLLRFRLALMAFINPSTQSIRPDAGKKNLMRGD
jgi:hypothetical protein